MQKIKQLFSIINWPIFFMIGQFFFLILFAMIFQLQNYQALFPEEMGSERYQQQFTLFVEQNKVLIASLNCFLFYPLLKRVYEKEKQVCSSSLSCLDIGWLLMMGASFSLLFNGIVYTINDIIPFVSYQKPNMIISLLITTVFLGPIMEEYIYRGIVYTRLKKITTSMKAILWTTFFFGIVHSGVVGIVYAMVINFMLIYVYELYGSLKASILFHMGANASVLFLGILMNCYWQWKLVIMVISIILLIKGYYFSKQQYMKKCGKYVIHGTIKEVITVK